MSFGTLSRDRDTYASRLVAGLILIAVAAAVAMVAVEIVT
jgi:hypothetical protein